MEEGAFYARPEYVKIPLAEAGIERVVKAENHHVEIDSRGSSWTAGTGQRIHASSKNGGSILFRHDPAAIPLLRPFDRRWQRYSANLLGDWPFSTQRPSE